MNEDKKILEVDMKRIIRSLIDHIWSLVLVGVICGGILFGYSYFFITPQYSASIQVYVDNTYGNSTSGFSSSQISAAQSLARTYMVILKSRPVMNEVAEITGLPYTYEQLVNMTVSSTVAETEVFETTVTCSNYKHAAQIANAIAQVLPDKSASVVEGSSVRVLDYAVENSQRISPSYLRYALVGFSIGFLLAALVVAVTDALDRLVHSEEFLEEAYEDMPLLAVIPDATASQSYGYRKGYYKGYYASAEDEQSPRKTGGEK